MLLPKRLSFGLTLWLSALLSQSALAQTENNTSSQQKEQRKQELQQVVQDLSERKKLLQNQLKA